jgi:hypothetical protein
LYEIIPGFVLGSMGVVLGTLLDKKPSDAVVKQYDAAWQLIRQSPN